MDNQTLGSGVAETADLKAITDVDVIVQGEKSSGCYYHVVCNGTKLREDADEGDEGDDTDRLDVTLPGTPSMSSLLTILERRLQSRGDYGDNSSLDNMMIALYGDIPVEMSFFGVGEQTVLAQQKAEAVRSALSSPQLQSKVARLFAAQQRLKTALMSFMDFDFDANALVTDTRSNIAQVANGAEGQSYGEQFEAIEGNRCPEFMGDYPEAYLIRGEDLEYGETKLEQSLHEMYDPFDGADVGEMLFRPVDNESDMARKRMIVEKQAARLSNPVMQAYVANLHREIMALKAELAGLGQ